MVDILSILLVIAMGVTLLVLFSGLVSMARGGEFDRRNANRLMRLRVLSQGVAIVIFAVLFFVIRGG